MASSSAKTRAMKCSKAQIRASVEHNRKCDSITIRPSKEDGERVRKAAKEAGIPLQRFIMGVLLSYLDGNEGETNGVQ